MTCHQAQTSLCLYLYGELDFAQEEQLEQHLGECALCERALAREKTWHTTLNSGTADAPLELLSQCRQELKAKVSRLDRDGNPKAPRSWYWADLFGFSQTRWSMRVAVASFLLFTGFAAARWIDRNGLPVGILSGSLTVASLINPSAVQIRDIQPGGGDRVRIVFDQVREQEVIGRIDDQDVRRLLLSATRDPDPGIRVDSVEMLNGQNGDDIRAAFIFSVQHDPNAGVRLKALEGLRPFADDPTTLAALKRVLDDDDNLSVRSEAVDVLAPLDKSIFSPALAGTLQEVVRSDRDDDYVRMRCLRVLHKMKASLDVH